MVDWQPRPHWRRGAGGRLAANKLLRPVLEIRSYANDILEHGVNVTGELDAVPNLERTAQLAAAARQGVTRCGDALRGLR